MEKTAASVPAKPTRSTKEIRRVADIFKQVSDGTRLAVLATLSRGRRNVTELVGDLGVMSLPAVSHHLALLKAGRLIECERAGKNHYYALTETGRTLAELADKLIAAE